MNIRIAHKHDPNRDTSPTALEKLALVEAVELGIIEDSENYKLVLGANQGAWKPLKPKYVKLKAKKGLGTTKWVLTGSTLRALTTPISISGRKSEVPGRRLTIKSLGKKRLYVSFFWTMLAPSASGWPGKQKKRTWFRKDNRVRPFWNHITPLAEEKVLENMMAVVIRYFNRIF